MTIAQLCLLNWNLSWECEYTRTHLTKEPVMEVYYIKTLMEASHVNAHKYV